MYRFHDFSRSLKFGALSFIFICLELYHLFLYRRKDDFAMRKRTDASIADEVYIDFMPKAKHLISTTTLDLPVDAPKLSFCFAWQFKKVPGSKSVWGKGNRSDTATGIVCWCRMLADNSSPVTILIFHIFKTYTIFLIHI